MVAFQEFASAFIDGKLKEFFKSQPIPETVRHSRSYTHTSAMFWCLNGSRHMVCLQNDGAVKVVVGKNFDDIVLDESRDVLLEVNEPRPKIVGTCKK